MFARPGTPRRSFSLQHKLYLDLPRLISVQKNSPMPSLNKPRPFWIQICTHPLNFGRAPTPEDRRGFMLTPFGQNSRRNRCRI
jgi:hypothetical protein